MKTKWIYCFSCFIFLYLAAFPQAFPQDASRPVKPRSPMYNLEFQMQMQQLDAQQIASYEGLAIQKMKDFLGYVAILADSSLDGDFKERAEQRAVRFFVDAKSCNEFLGKMGIQNEVEAMTFTSSFGSKQDRNAGFFYEGEVALKLAEKSELLMIPVYLLKVEKSFGKEKKMVWELKFGI